MNLYLYNYFCVKKMHKMQVPWHSYRNIQSEITILQSGRSWVRVWVRAMLGVRLRIGFFFSLRIFVIASMFSRFVAINT